MQAVPLYTLKLPLRRNPISVIPQRSAGDRQAGRSTHSGQQRNAGHRSLLHEFKAGAPADQHHRFAQRRAKAQQRMTDQLVYRVVPADVFTQRLQFALWVEKRRGVESARALKNVLPLTQLMRKLMDHTRIDPEAV